MRDGMPVAKAVFSADEILVDEVGDEDAEAAPAGDPTHKSDVDVGRVFRLVIR